MTRVELLRWYADAMIEEHDRFTVRARVSERLGRPEISIEELGLATFASQQATAALREARAEIMRSDGTR